MVMWGKEEGGRRGVVFFFVSCQFLLRIDGCKSGTSDLMCMYKKNGDGSPLFVVLESSSVGQ